MTKAVFSLAMSLIVMVMHYSKHALSGDLKALSLNMYWHPIDLVAAKLGSRPSASPNLPLS
jgi:hypothetical protein